MIVNGSSSHLRQAGAFFATAGRLLRAVGLGLALLLGTGPGTSLAAASEAAARAVFAIGEITVTGENGATRKLEKGGKLFEGETITVARGSAAQLIFRDQSRLALRPLTVMRIDAYSYSADKPAEDRSTFSLLKGAMRSISGLLGKRSRERASFSTPSATIGIRGTDFEAVHVPEVGGADTEAFGAQTAPGTYNKVYAGGTRLESAAGAIDLDVDQVGFVGADLGGKPLKVDALPAGVQKLIDSVPLASARPPSNAPEGGGDTAEAGPREERGEGQKPGNEARVQQTPGGEGNAMAPADAMRAPAAPEGGAVAPPGGLEAATPTRLSSPTTTTVKTLDPATTTLSPTTVTKLPTTTTTTLSPTTTTKLPTTTTTTTLPTSTTTLSPTTTTKLPTTTTTTLPTSTTTLSPTTTTKLPTTTTTTLPTSTTTLSPTTTTKLPTTTTTTLPTSTTTLSPTTTTKLPTTSTTTLPTSTTTLSPTTTTTTTATPVRR